MRYPNLRYGNPETVRFYGSFYGDSNTYIKNLAQSLKRDERTVKDWINGRKKVPWWVPELLRLRDLERRDTLRQMRIPAGRLAIVTQDSQLSTRRKTDLVKKPPALTDLRLDDFDRPTRAG